MAKDHLPGKGNNELESVGSGQALKGKEKLDGTGTAARSVGQDAVLAGAGVQQVVEKPTSESPIPFHHALSRLSDHQIHASTALRAFLSCLRLSPDSSGDKARLNFQRYTRELAEALENCMESVKTVVTEATEVLSQGEQIDLGDGDVINMVDSSVVWRAMTFARSAEAYRLHLLTAIKFLDRWAENATTMPAATIPTGKTAARRPRVKLPQRLVIYLKLGAKGMKPQLLPSLEPPLRGVFLPRQGIRIRPKRNGPRSLQSLDERQGTVDPIPSPSIIYLLLGVRKK
jgi:hypothetical protein